MNVILAKETTLNAKGKRNNGRCKAVICITTGERYSSVTDAAEHEGVHWTSISNCCTGRTQTANGKVWRFAKEGDCVDALAGTLQEKLALLEKYSPYIAEQEAKELEEKRLREEEEKRRLDEEKRQELIAKAKEKYTRREQKFEKAKADLEKALIKLEKAEAELQALAC